MRLGPIALTVLGLAAIAAGAVVFGALRWSTKTRQLEAGLETARLPPTPTSVDFHQLAGLPAPVARYFRTVLTDGQPMIAAVRLRHSGTFNVGDDADRWRPFTSEQRVVTTPRGFLWNARVSVAPGLVVRVHDAYVDGEGILLASLMGLFAVADLKGTHDIAQGELMRFVAESVWYPTALLPSQGVQWESVDGQSARATVTDREGPLTLTFGFDAQGLVESVRAEARGRAVGNQVVPTPWRGRFWHYEKRGHMMVPFEGEVAWLLAEGPRPYWRGRITEIAYEFAR